MRATQVGGHDVVGPARSGDREALGQLVTMHLPFLYTIVRRALGAHPDVDDVVQEVMLRVLRQLPALRDVESFGPWLAAIAVRQVSTYLRREHRAAERAAVLDEVAEAADLASDVESSTLLQLELTAQRRQIVRASAWLDPDDRALVPLWWLETAGQMTRSELAAALGVSAAHAAVRVQRMRHQLDLARSLVVALSARPGCPVLDGVVARWDGAPNPLWRKRIARHTRSCPVCLGAADPLLPAERLLVGFALLPVPVTLTASLLSQSAAGSAPVTAASAVAGAKVGFLTQLAKTVVAHPLMSIMAGGALIAGAAVAAIPAVAPEPPSSVTSGPTSAVPARLAPGMVSLEAINARGYFVSVAGDVGVLAATDNSADRGRPTFEAVPGLADPRCFSFRSPDGRYLRHSSWRLRLTRPDGTALFRGDATFCPVPGSAPGSVTLESANYPGWFLRHVSGELWVDRSDGSETFRADSSFLVWAPRDQ